MLAARRERGAALLASPGISHWAMLRVTRACAGRGGGNRRGSARSADCARWAPCLPVSIRRGLLPSAVPRISPWRRSTAVCVRTTGPLAQRARRTREPGQGRSWALRTGQRR
jgi:hypothetical protein